MGKHGRICLTCGHFEMAMCLALISSLSILTPGFWLLDWLRCHWNSHYKYLLPQSVLLNGRNSTIQTELLNIRKEIIPQNLERKWIAWWPSNLFCGAATQPVVRLHWKRNSQKVKGIPEVVLFAWSQWKSLNQRRNFVLIVLFKMILSTTQVRFSGSHWLASNDTCENQSHFCTSM